MSYEWFHYREPGTLNTSSSRIPGAITITDADKAVASFTAPTVTKPETMHVVLAVTDQGTPPLTRYKRVIITIHPSATGPSAGAAPGPAQPGAQAAAIPIAGMGR